MSRRSLSEATLGDLALGVKRYSPFIAAVAAIVLLVAFLPGKPAPSSNTGGAVAASGAGTGNSAGSGGSSAGSGSNLTGSGSSGGAGGSVSGSSGGSAAGGGSAGSSGSSGGSTGSGGSGATASASPPAATSDPYCDTSTGRVKIPSLYAAPCEPPYSGNNGGATYNGVTADTITIALPKASNQAEAQAVAKAANDNDTDPQRITTYQNYLSFFEHHVQTYGRKFKVVTYTSSYNTADSTAAQNSECQSDAEKVAKQIHAFISWNDCGTNAYENTLAREGVLCFCTVTIPESYYLQWAPYVWGTGLPDETSAYLMRAEVICDEIAPYPPKYAGEADLNSPIAKKRLFALLWPGASALDNTDIYRAGANYFAGLLQQCGVTLKENDSFPIVDPNGPADAQILMAKFKSEGVTDVILVADPIDPIFLTGAATKQNYYPEWIDTGSALIDTTHFGRLYDQSQWNHSFGVSFLGDRVPQKDGDAYNLYQWAYNSAPPAATEYATSWYPFSWEFSLGVSLAGPHLTPYTYQCGEPPYTSSTHAGALGSKSPVPCVGKVYKGLFGAPISPTDYQQRVTNPVVAFGSRLWPWDDYNQIDDGVLIWWNPKASGPDENGSNGNGEQEFVNGGKRYLYGQFPKGNQDWFNPATSVTIFSSLPGPDQPPKYPYQSCYYLCNSPGY